LHTRLSRTVLAQSLTVSAVDLPPRPAMRHRSPPDMLDAKPAGA
jgi:hypothetical protein